MGFLQDNLIPFFKNRELTFVEKCQEMDGVYSFQFKKTDDLTWKAGQYGLFTITHKKIKSSTKPFTVSAAPAENIVQLTTRISDEPSEFKQALLELNEGMTVSMRGPVGPFYLKDHTPALFIAGGMGITPFRSILKQLEAEGKKDGQHNQLLYMDRSQSYLFKDELEEIARKTAVKVSFLDAKEALDEAIGAFTTLNKSDGKYFIAGPKTFVDDVFGYLTKNGIHKKNIIKDAFWGY